MLKHYENFELLQLALQQTLSKNRVSSRHCVKNKAFLMNKM